MSPAVNVTCYGGINEIGGNKVLLEDEGKRLLLDFGFPYKRHKLFYEEYLKPRAGAGLLDLLSMGLLPAIQGIYRKDIEPSGVWSQLAQHTPYRSLEKVDGLLLSHAHLDHSGHIALLDGELPVYSTAVTAFITKAIQDSGRADFDQQVCYFSPAILETPPGWRQDGFLSGGSKQQRRFCISDIDPATLSSAAIQYWQSGFWAKTGRQKEFLSSQLSGHHDSAFKLKCLPVDHSIPGACAWAIETSSGWIVYSGDLRLHGKKAELTRNFIEAAARLKPRALILEGTNVLRQTNVREQDVYENGLRAISGTRGLVIADFPARDIDRLLTFLEIARQCGRKLAILPRDAYMLKTLRLLDTRIPDINEGSSIVIYQDTTSSRSPSLWSRKICQECDASIVLANDVHSDQNQFILCFSFFDINELPSILPAPGSLYVFSSSEPHDEEQEIDFRRLHNWLNHFGIKGIGLPVEHNGEWRVPEDERELHASGHACGKDLIQIAREIAPDILIPIHTEHPGFYAEHLAGTSSSVIVPSLGKTIEV